MPVEGAPAAAGQQDGEVCPILSDPAATLGIVLLVERRRLLAAFGPKQRSHIGRNHYFFLRVADAHLPIQRDGSDIESDGPKYQPLKARCGNRHRIMPVRCRDRCRTILPYW